MLRMYLCLYESPATDECRQYHGKGASDLVATDAGGLVHGLSQAGAHRVLVCLLPA